MPPLLRISPIFPPTPESLSVTSAAPRQATFSKLESLRGVAACLVAIHHSPFTVAGAPGSFVGSSYLFVDFFFMLSGFVMTHAYRDKILQGLQFRAYAMLRVARLYPLHVFTHFLFLIIVLAKSIIYSFGVGPADPAASLHVPSFWTGLFLLQAFGIHDWLYWNRPSWSISAELGAYVAFFLLTKTLDRAGHVLPPLIAAAALYAALLVFDGRRLDLTYDLGALRCLAGFYGGSFLYRIRRTVTANAVTMPRGARGIAEVGAVTASALSVACAPRGNLFVMASLFAFAASILTFSSSKSGALGTVLESNALRKLGLWSYSIYLLHLIFFETAGNVAEYAFGMQLSNGVGGLAVALDVAVLAGVVFISKYSYQAIEVRFRSPRGRNA